MIDKRMLIIGAIIILILSVFAGPVLFQISVNTNTQNSDHGGIHGTGELIGPNNRKGFIASYKNDGLSETITCIGKAEIDTWATAGMDGYYYTVEGKTETSGWIMLSKPGETSMAISNPNPGIKSVSGIQIGGTFTAEAYSFEVIGNDYKAIRVTFKGHIDGNLLNPFDEGHIWRTLQVDRAYIYSGYGGLYLPTGIDDGVERPYSTFEIGQEVKIRVETAKGGQTVDGTGTWRVTLNEPYTESINEPDAGGGIILEKSYNDDTIGYFTFTVTEEMAENSMNSDQPYTVRIWNTILPTGTLHIDFIDFIKKAPSEVYLDGPIQSKVGDLATVSLSANVNGDTQAPIEHFRVSVIYGTNGVLLPSNPNSNFWLIHTTNVDATKSGNKYIAQIEFRPQFESYVTVHSKAQDTEGRWSPITKTWTLWAYESVPVDEDIIDDETGEDDYGGGNTQPWLPWDPSGGNWEQTIYDSTPIIAAIVVFFIFLLISLLPQVPIPFGIYGRMFMILIGIAISVLTYLILKGEIRL